MMRASRLSSRMITTFGLGFMRPASGTWGSLPPVIWAGVLIAAAGLTTLDHWIWWVYYISLLGVLVAFSWSVIAGGDRAEAVYGQDPSEVVADETAGQCIPLLLIPPGVMASPLTAAWAVLLAFVLFRLLDISKLWPGSRVQRMPGAWGILLDDVVAGLYAAAGLWIAFLASR